ncbi:hypothetical protein [Xylocopilactobacillus apicola]|uniref:Lipoprotein n=1 Tax=Xylocopilactobacillus apicola TaxID=2932184 RepID=A0AAU9D2R9_9LACO|nr:hypothetical protein [Xylocopilactobacillus apicola]BDR59106.1 hypothetical protein XA3_15470 [Xylocopilactobacillus apicola]
MFSNLKGTVLFLGVLTLLAGCQKNESSSSFSSNISSSKPSKKNQNSAPEIEKISVEEYQKLSDDNDSDGKIVFFETPGKSDDALKKFSTKCQKIGKKLYTVDVSTDEGKKILEEDKHIKSPYDAIILRKGSGSVYLDLLEKEVPTEILKTFLDMDLKKEAPKN